MVTVFQVLIPVSVVLLLITLKLILHRTDTGYLLAQEEGAGDPIMGPSGNRSCRSWVGLGDNRAHLSGPEAS